MDRQEALIKEANRKLKNIHKVIKTLDIRVMKSANMLWDDAPARMSYADFINGLHDGVRLGLVQMDEHQVDGVGPIKRSFRLREVKLDMPLNY